MINYPFGEFDDTMKKLSDKRIRSVYGMSPELFYNLPYEVQCALLKNYWVTQNGCQDKTNGEEMPIQGEKHNTKLDAFRKRMALRQYVFEENVKEKILTLFRKNK